MEIDDLAIHVVASSGRKILADLNSHAGRDLDEYAIALSIYYCAVSYNSGMLPAFVDQDADLQRYVCDVAALINSGVVSSPEDIDVSLTNHLKRIRWGERLKHFNFLKHADNDAVSVIYESDIDNISVLREGIVAYLALYPEQMTEAMNLFSFFCAWKDGDKTRLSMKVLFDATEGFTESELKAGLAAMI